MGISKITTVLVLGLSFTLTACSLFQSQDTMSDSSTPAVSGNSDYDRKLAEVSAKYKEIDKAGGAWTISDETLEKAAEAIKAKDIDKAMKLLKDADEEIELAKAQFESQKNARPHLF